MALGRHQQAGMRYMSVVCACACACTCTCSLTCLRAVAGAPIVSMGGVMCAFQVATNIAGK